MYEQLAAIIREQITAGKLPEDEAVPSQAEMVSAYGVSRGSVARAMSLLQAEGLLRSVRGKGQYVTVASERAALTPPARSRGRGRPKRTG